MFGCLCFVHNCVVGANKLDPRAIRVIFFGYSPIQKKYKCYDHRSGKWYVSKDVTFVEHVPYFT